MDLIIYMNLMIYCKTSLKSRTTTYNTYHVMFCVQRLMWFGLQDDETTIDQRHREKGANYFRGR